MAGNKITNEIGTAKLMFCGSVVGDALCYSRKVEGSRLEGLIEFYKFAYSFRPHYASNRNEYQGQN